MKKNNNHIIVDLSKVQWAEFKWLYRNAGYESRNLFKPAGNSFSIYGQWYHKDEKCRNGKTIFEVAKNRDAVDTYIPELTLQLTANHTLIYTGEKALSIWEAWKAKIFGKERKKK